jgi:drug/metabolite transporter (DMT)-like permease
VWLAGVGFALGEQQQWNWSTISWESWLAWSYLLVAGSLVAFTTFVWLMKHCSPTTVSTYAYVNPIVAVILGWWILDEVIDRRVLVAAATIVIAVAMITISKQQRAPRDDR